MTTQTDIAVIIENQPGDAAYSGRRWYCRLIPVGAGYGREDAVINNDGKPMVEVWDFGNSDVRGAHENPERGQFTSARYYVETLMQDYKNPEREKMGLDLQWYVPAWTMDAPAYREMLDWLAEVTA